MKLTKQDKDFLNLVERNYSWYGQKAKRETMKLRRLFPFLSVENIVNAQDIARTKKYSTTLHRVCDIGLLKDNIRNRKYFHYYTLFVLALQDKWRFQKSELAESLRIGNYNQQIAHFITFLRLYQQKQIRIEKVLFSYDSKKPEGMKLMSATIPSPAVCHEMMKWLIEKSLYRHAVSSSPPPRKWRQRRKAYRATGHTALLQPATKCIHDFIGKTTTITFDRKEEIQTDPRIGLIAELFILSGIFERSKYLRTKANAHKNISNWLTRS